MFLQKLITLFVLRSFNSDEVMVTGNMKSDQITNKICNINYLCSLLATSGKEIIPIKILLESLNFLVKFFKRRFHSKSHADQYDASSSNSENETPSKLRKGKMRIDDKLFYISVVQGLSYILTFKMDVIETQDPNLLTRILKLILNNEHKAALYNQTHVLQQFLDAMKNHRIAPKYIRRMTKLMKGQKNFLRYKKDLFNRIKRKMPFGTPLFLIESGVFFNNIHSHLPNNQIQESISKTLIPPENKPKATLRKKVIFEEEKIPKTQKEDNFEDKQFNAAMLASFNTSRRTKKSDDIRKSIFGKLNRSLSVDYKHKLKANHRPSQDSSNRNAREIAPKTLQTTSVTKIGEAHFDLTDSVLVGLENNSDGYVSDKNTDVASIDFLDEYKPWLHRRKNRSRNRNRMLKRF